MEDKIINLIKTGVPIIQIISYETQRIHGIIDETAKKHGSRLVCLESD